jgi:hypothetical protein
VRGKIKVGEDNILFEMDGQCFDPTCTENCSKVGFPEYKLQIPLEKKLLAKNNSDMWLTVTSSGSSFIGSWRSKKTGAATADFSALFGKYEYSLNDEKTVMQDFQNISSTEDRIVELA